MAVFWASAFAAPPTTRPTIATPPIVLAPPALPTTALPSGGTIVSGTGSISERGADMTITQDSSHLVADWNSFDIGANASVTFVQPSAQSAALNRVLGADPSQIEGTLKSNGQVFLVNPNGVIFAKHAQVDVGGIVATTMELSNADFAAGNDVLAGTGSAAAVINQGSVSSAPAGYVVLAASKVSNSGAIDAPLGTVALAAGDRVTLAIGTTGLLRVSVDAAAVNALAANSGRLKADGGQVLMTVESANSVPGLALSAGGTIEAHGIGLRQGHVFLDGGAGDTDVSATIAANQVAVTGQNVDVLPAALLDVSGPAGGGVIEIGGELHGGGTLAHATNVTIESGATLLANATGPGNGGTIAVWSDGSTEVSGTLEAMGGERGGNGGMIETSGHVLGTPGIAINASAPFGAAGIWLLDPYNLTVSSTASTATQSPTGTWTSSSGASVVLNTDINSALNGGTSVMLQTSGTLGDGRGNGDITVNSPVAKTAGGNASLTLDAAGSIIVNAGIGSSTGALNTTLDANILGGGGYVSIQAPIRTNGGALIIGGGTTPATGPAVGTAAETSGVYINAALSTGGGAITVTGTGYNSNATGNYGIDQNAAISSGGGAITLTGTGGGTGLSEHGIYVNATSVSGAGGNVSVSGLGSATGIGSGVYLTGAASTISTTGAGTLTVNGTAAGSGAEADYGVYLGNATSVISSVNGPLSVTGTNTTTSTTSGQIGVDILSGATIESTGTGAITVIGTGGGRDTTGADYGLYIQGSAGIAATLAGGNSPITLTGTGGDAGGTGSTNYGVYINGALAGNGGTVLINGTGGNSSGTANTGIYALAPLTNTGTGAITMTATGGSSGSAESGFYTDANVTAGTGNISISGTAATQKGGADNAGVETYGGTISTGGAGTITLNGTATGAGAAAQGGSGVNISGPVSAVNGLISITGLNLSSDTYGQSFGVLIATSGVPGKITSTGTGGVTVMGTAGGAGAGQYDDGLVSYGAANTIQSTGSGAISLTGIGGDATGSGFGNNGVYLGGAVSAAGGPISVTGTGGNASGTGNYGIDQNAAISSGGGAITLTGTGGGTGLSEHGIYVNATSVSGAGGNVSVSGLGSATGIGSGVYLTGAASTISTTGAGTLTVNGTAAGSGAEADYGVYLGNATSVISSVNGPLSVTGTNTTTSTTSGQIGVDILSGATIESTGTGAITVIGTGGGRDTTGADYGLYIQGSAGIAATLAGGNSPITLTGTGGDAGGTGAGNDGVYLNAALLGNGGNIAITGTGGMSSGGSNEGISLASVAAGTATLTLTSTGTVTSSGALTAANLALLGTGGSFALTNAGNQVTTLAANTGSVNYAQTGALGIGTVGATTGVAGTGTVLVDVIGNMTLANGAAVSAAGTGDALQLIDSGNFTNDDGARALTVTGGGRWLVWSVSRSNDMRGGLAPGFIQYGATYGVATPADAIHNGLLYSMAGDSLIASLTGTVSKVYDTTNVATLAAANYTTAGEFTGDTVTLNDPTAGTFDTIHVGTGKTVTATGVAIVSVTNGSATVYGDTLASTTVTGAIGTITPATLTAGLTGTVSKTYDTTKSATLAANNYTLSGVLGSDAVTLNEPTAGTYDTIHVGTGKTVTVNGLSISGTNSSDYQLVSTTADGAVGTITPAMLSAALTGTVAKIYDTTTAATLVANYYTLGGVLGSDAVTLNDPTTGTYDTIHVGTGKTITVNGLAISGANSSDYQLVSTTAEGAVGTITAATLTAGLTGTVSKTYDTTKSATLAANNYTLSGVLGNDTVTLNDPRTGTYDTIQVGTGETVSVTGLAISGASASDYQLASNSTSGAVGTIIPASGGSSTDSTGRGYVPTAGQNMAFAAMIGEGSSPGGTTGGGTLSMALPSDGASGSNMTTASPANDCASSTNSGGTIYCTAPDDEITLTMLRSATKQRAGMVSVSVPEEIVSRGKSVRFPLPKEIAEVAGNDELQVTQKNGKSLSSWLTYTRATKTFSANGVPVGALPSEFLLSSGAYGWTMNITERAKR